MQKTELQMDYDSNAENRVMNGLWLYYPVQQWFSMAATVMPSDMTTGNKSIPTHCFQNVVKNYIFHKLFNPKQRNTKLKDAKQGGIKLSTALWFISEIVETLIHVKLQK